MGAQGIIREFAKDNRYHVFDIPLNVARADVALGIQSFLASQGIPGPINYMAIITLPAAMQFKVNSISEQLLTAVLNEEWEDFEIMEVYITNGIGVGTAQIYVEYKVD